jgi:hypothetical protein
MSIDVVNPFPPGNLENGYQHPGIYQETGRHRCPIPQPTTPSKMNANTWMEKGLDALATDMEKSTANTIRDLACAAWFVTSTASGVGLVINAAIILL